MPSAVLMVGANYNSSDAICGVSYCYRYEAAFSYANNGGRLLS